MSRTAASGRTSLDYYVDATNGNDSNSGKSTNAPWKTIAKVNAATFAPGSGIYFKRGETWNERLQPVLSGATGSPIVYADYGIGALPIIQHATNGGCYLTGVHDLSLYNLDFRGGTFFAFDITGTVPAPVDDILCSGLDVSGADTSGIYLTGVCDSITFLNCNSHNNEDSGLLMGQITNVLVDGGNYYSNGHGAVDQYHGIYVSDHAANVTIKNVIAYSNVGHGIAARTHQTGLLIEKNKTYSNGFTGIHVQQSEAANGNRVQNNISYSNGEYGIALGADCVAYAIYHNTLVNNNAQGLKLEETSTLGNTIKNNLVVQDRAVVDDGDNCVRGPAAAVQGNTLDNNNYIFIGDTTPCNQAGTEYTLVNWKALTGSPDPNSISSDPDFVTDYTDFHLNAGSPCKLAGATGTGVTTDYAGTTRGATPSIGAYE